jgi:hypothetical protein
MRASFRICLLLALAGALVIGHDCAAGNEVPPSPRFDSNDRPSFSMRALPQSHCAAYLVLEAAALFRAVNSQKTTDLYHRDGSHRYGEDFALPVAGQANLGLMLNVSQSNSLGMVAFAALEERHSRAGLKLRYRFWEWVGTAIDIECGLARDLTTDVFSEELNRRQWVVGGLSLSHTRFLHFVFQLESWLQDYPPKRRTSAAYVGLRFGY